MRRFLSLLAVAVACLALAQPPQQQQPQPQVRTVGHLDLNAYRMVASPNGRFLAITTPDSLLIMEVASGRHSTVLRRQSSQSWEFDEIDWSPRGDLLAFSRGDDAQKTEFIWTLPIDQNTGRSTGEARRVSTAGGDLVAVSPDGQSILFLDFTLGKGALERIVLVPARGGRERVLAEPRVNINSMAWSADGRWVYYAWSSGPSKTRVARVPVSGGASQVVLEAPGDNPYVIKPGPVIIVHEADRMIRLVDSTGSRTKALFRAPQGRYVDMPAANADATRFYAAVDNRSNRLTAVSLVDGNARLMDTSQDPHGIATSESGNRLVFRTLTDGVRRLVVLNLDGSGRREYRTQHESRGGETLSPDGTHLAFQSVDSVPQLILLDLQSGAERVLTTASGLGGLRWRSDGQLQYVRMDSAPSPSRAIHEVTIDGRDRVVRLHPDMGSLISGFGLLDDTLAIFAPRGRLELVPLPRGDTRVIFRGPHAGVALSLDHRFLAIKTVSRIAPVYADSTAVAIREADAIAIVDLRTGQRRDLVLDFRMRTSVSNYGSRVHAVLWHPDGRNLIVGMSRPGQAQEDVYLVPLNGDMPRLIQRGSSPDTRIALTADGKTVLVSLPSQRTTDILEFTLPGAKPGGTASREK
jgi:Tol biopolymer transport system component